MRTIEARTNIAYPELIPARIEDQPILANLLELYLHDFSQFVHLELHADGRFGYPNLSLYWSEAGRHPFLVRINGSLAGLVLVKRAPGVSTHEPMWDMAEFFIVRGHRRHGIGTQIADQVWRFFPGPWQIRVMESNEPARQFWARAIEKFTGQPIQSIRIRQNEQDWHVFTFDSSQGCKSL
jgi:predicted acetyltransferase